MGTRAPSAADTAASFVDAGTGRSVQLTNSREHSVHAYYDTQPWCPRTGRIAFTRRRHGANVGDVYVMDADGANPTRLATSRAVTPNHGAVPQWSPDGQRVYFRDREADGPLVCWVDVRTGERGSHRGDLWMARPVGSEHAYCSDARRLSDEEIVNSRDEHGVFVQDLGSGTRRRLVSVNDCVELHPRRSDIADWHVYVKHPKWSPAGDRLIFLLLNTNPFHTTYGELPAVKDVYVVNADGTGLRHLGEAGNHSSWHPSGREVLGNGSLPSRPGRSLVLTDVDSGRQRLASDLMAAGRSHPSYAPDGVRIVVDQVVPGERHGSINIIDTENNTVDQVIRTAVTDHSHSGTHLHPVWSRDGRQILYASDASGVAQLCVVTLDQP